MMAKKAAETAKVAGRGKKACPACGEVLGARQAVCPKCNHVFEAKAGGSRKPTSSKNGMDAIKATLAFINATGGIEEAKSQIADMMVLLAACGGSAEALAAIEQIEEIQKLTTKKK